ncbi:hypothetical protein [Tautonia rosea]|uniref:hypothetical protein n=1 Tax=Tautonia rosea TaxID=2728037 RepID=UPI00147373D2|nr:hypothetical protein [Tautonia rosea]
MSDSDSIREVVHDLRNRLSAIASAATAIRKSQFEKELGEEMLEIIRNNVEQATASLNALDMLGSQGEP